MLSPETLGRMLGRCDSGSPWCIEKICGELMIEIEDPEVFMYLNEQDLEQMLEELKKAKEGV